MNLKGKNTELRSGLTTGTCATAVAKASAYMLVKQTVINHIMVTLPSGKNVVLELCNCFVNLDFAQCSVIKDAGDDPDITHGAEIVGKSSFTGWKKVELKAGKGIGKVTKAGLAVEVGQPAINPVPLKMIKQAISDVVPKGVGVAVEISIPKGEELAKKTFNPRLGIVDGISVLGTTGIVKPMSEEALKDSLIVELKQVAALGNGSAVFTPGNYGQAFSKQNMKVPDDRTVIVSNYVGFMLEQAVRYSFKKVVLVGHLGKLVKVAGGVFQTHSKVADARNEILAAHYFHFTNDALGFQKIMKSNTTEEVVEMIQDKSFWKYLAEKIKMRSQHYVHDELTVEVVLLSQKVGLLGVTEKAYLTLEEIANG